MSCFVFSEVVVLGHLVVGSSGNQEPVERATRTIRRHFEGHVAPAVLVQYFDRLLLEAAFVPELNAKLCAPQVTDPAHPRADHRGDTHLRGGVGVQRHDGLAIERIDQWVASSGVAYSVCSITAAT